MLVQYWFSELTFWGGSSRCPKPREFFNFHQIFGLPNWPLSLFLYFTSVDSRIRPNMSNSVDEQAGLGIETEIPEDLIVEQVWKTLLKKIEQPGLFLPGVTEVVFKPHEDGTGTYRVMAVGSLKIIELIHATETILEVNFKMVSDNYEIVNRITTNSETLRSKLEFFKRDSKSKERIHWVAPKKVGYERIQQIFDFARTIV
jgi:hypothetical protein